MIKSGHQRRRLTRSASVALLAWPNTSVRLLYLLMAIAALAIQILVVQTHIHIPQSGGQFQTVSLVKLAAAALSDNPHAAGDICPESTPRDRYPIGEDPSNCPLCQEVVHCGQYVASAAILAVLPVTATVHFILLDEALPSFFAASHIWRGRAPPRS